MAFKFLISCMGAELIPQLVQNLRKSQRHNVEIIGVDVNPNAVGRHFCDSFYAVPRGDAKGYASAIANIVSRHEVDLILPTSDEEALALSGDRELIEKNGCRLACTDAETLQVIANKVETYRRLDAEGLAMPRWAEAKSVDRLEAVVSEMASQFENFVVKPAAARGGRGVCIISGAERGVRRFDDRREIHMNLASFKDKFLAGFAAQMPAIVMERLVEPVYDLDMLAWQGEPLRLVARKRIDSAVPNEGHTIVDTESLYELGRKIIRKLNLSWLYDCDIMMNQEGMPCILEINPRPSGSVSVSVMAGIPLIEDIISLAKDETIPDVSVPFGARVVPYKALRVI